jgi:DNA-binding response OmpR family regulator
MEVATKLTGLRVLVLEDDPDARELAEIVLTDAGAKVKSVASVAEMWRLFDDYVPHVIVSDIHMPDVSGLDMVKALRQRRVIDGGYTGVVAVTALALEKQRQEGLRQGFDRYLTKPFHPDELVEAVSELART